MVVPPVKTRVPTVVIAQDEAEILDSIVYEEVHKGCDQYDTFLRRYQGKIPHRKWKSLVEDEDVQVYVEKPSTRSMFLKTNEHSMDYNQQPILIIGRVPGTMEDAMLGALSYTTMLMKLKDKYQKTNIMDMAVLADVREKCGKSSSKNDPFRQTTVNWKLQQIDFSTQGQEQQSSSHPRDLVYINATGITRLPTGLRVGYHLERSLEIPVEELPRVVRAITSFLTIYRDTSTPGLVEVYRRGWFDPKGSVTRAAALKYTANTHIRVWDNIETGQLMKLRWLVKESSFNRILLSKNNESPSLECSECCQRLDIGPRGWTKSCRSCFRMLCGDCYEMRSLCFPLRSGQEIFQKSHPFCSRCIARANLSNSQLVAQDAGDANERRHLARTDLQEASHRRKAETKEDTFHMNNSVDLDDADFCITLDPQPPSNNNRHNKRTSSTSTIVSSAQTESNSLTSLTYNNSSHLTTIASVLTVLAAATLLENNLEKFEGNRIKSLDNDMEKKSAIDMIVERYTPQQLHNDTQPSKVGSSGSSAAEKSRKSSKVSSSSSRDQISLPDCQSNCSSSDHPENEHGINSESSRTSTKSKGKHSTRPLSTPKMGGLHGRQHVLFNSSSELEDADIAIDKAREDLKAFKGKAVAKLSSFSKGLLGSGKLKRNNINSEPARLHGLNPIWDDISLYGGDRLRNGPALSRAPSLPNSLHRSPVSSFTGTRDGVKRSPRMIRAQSTEGMPINPGCTDPNSIWRDVDLLQRRINARDIIATEVLGKGEERSIWLATYWTDVVVSKRLRPERKDAVSIQRFLNEVRITAKLDHPKIVPFLGVAWTTEFDVQMLLEYESTGDLRSYLDNSRLWNSHWSSEKLSIATDIAEAIVYLHSCSHKVLHRDIKAKNVYLDEDMNGRLGNFRRACYVDAKESDIPGIERTRWAPPEILMGTAGSTPASDIYSFGVMLLEIDSHHQPFDEITLSNGQTVPENILLGLLTTGAVVPKVRDDCPVELKELISDCLSHAPDNRPTALQVALRLQNIHIRYKHPKPIKFRPKLPKP